MIKQFDIRCVASYDENGVKFDNLKKINFIYGANATGKTTVSNFLHNSSSEDAKFKDCSLEWENDIALDVVTYNKSFRERNFGEGKLAGVFTIGEATKEHIEQIDKKKDALSTVKEGLSQNITTLENLKDEKEKLENEFREKTWVGVYKKHEKDFKEAFKGSQYKETFKNKLLQQAQSNHHELKSLDVLLEKAGTIFGKQPQSMELINEISFDRILEISRLEIWKKIIVGKADVDIAKLIQRLNINDWVNQGRVYIESETCPFCQQKTITDKFKKQLENYFDEVYLSDIEQIEKLTEEYLSLAQNVINELNGIEENQKSLENTKLNIDGFSAYLKTLVSQISTNIEHLKNKIKEPSRSISLISLDEQVELITVLVNEANVEITKHNHIVANYTMQRSNLIASIWRYLVEEYKAEINDFIRIKNGKESGIRNLTEQCENKSKEIVELDYRIKELTKSTTSIQPAIDEINRILELYGFLNFKIVPARESGYYSIEREDGSIANSTLSEGEVTFITFLYYLQRAKGGITEESASNERVLVIDDPISSLDSNILFVVSTLIKDVIYDIKSDKGNVKQLFLLTHNVYFHKEVAFICVRENKCSNRKFWVLRKNGKSTSLKNYGTDNPIQSSYELLWSELQSNEIVSTITIQNIMRRIIENYFTLLGRYKNEDIVDKFETKEEKKICRSLFHWINDGSHSILDDLYIELQDQSIEAYKNVFKQIFILTGQEGHYNMMMSIMETEGFLQEAPAPSA